MWLGGVCTAPVFISVEFAEQGHPYLGGMIFHNAYMGT